MKIGKIIKSDSHVIYKCRINGQNETKQSVSERDYRFGQFVLINLFDDIKAVGIIFNSQIINPEYGSFGPRLTTPSDYNNVISPDFIDEVAIMVDILLLGWNEDGESNQSTLPWVVPLYSEVEIMNSQDIKDFHNTVNSSLLMKYHHQILLHTNNFAHQLLLNIIDQLSQLLPKDECLKLHVIKKHIHWQMTNVEVGI